MGHEPPDRLVRGGLPPQGGLTVSGDVTSERDREELIIPTAGSFYDGSEPGGGVVVSPLSTGHYLPIYCDSYNIGTVSGGGVFVRSVGSMYMVGTGRPRLGGIEGGGEGCVSVSVGGYGDVGGGEGGGHYTTRRSEERRVV